MKKLTIFGMLIAGILAVSVAMTGCATQKPVSPGSPYQPAITNAATGEITPAVPAAPPQFVLVPNETITKGVAAVQPYVALAPDPWKTPIQDGLALLTAIAGIVATIQTRSAKKHKNAAAALAAGTVGNPTAIAAASQAALSNGSTAAVAEHLASANSPT